MFLAIVCYTAISFGLLNWYADLAEITPLDRMSDYLVVRLAVCASRLASDSVGRVLLLILVVHLFQGFGRRLRPHWDSPEFPRTEFQSVVLKVAGMLFTGLVGFLMLSFVLTVASICKTAG